MNELKDDAWFLMQEHPALTAHFKAHCLTISQGGAGCWFFLVTQKLGNLSQLLDQTTHGSRTVANCKADYWFAVMCESTHISAKAILGKSKHN
jgi:hypothetical protein